jgi:hypothetical protein
VVNSVSIIRQLLAGEQVDKFLIDLVPDVLGGGATLFEDGAAAVDLVAHRRVTAADGALLLIYDPPPGEPASARDERAEDTMATTPGKASSNLPGKPPLVDLATWQAAREELLVREKAHTHEGDAIAAARRRLPMVELDGAVEVTGVDGPVPFVDLF